MADDPNAQLTKADLLDIKVHLAEQFRTSEASMREQLQASEARMREQLQASEARRREQLQASEARTREQLQASEARTREHIAERLDVSEARMREQLQSSEERLHLYVEKIETNLLTAFHGWDSPMAGRVRKLETAPPVVDERLSALEDRMMAVEKRLGPTPYTPGQNQ
jgi:hypothetical protein